MEELRRKDIRAFLDWVYERAVAHEGTPTLAAMGLSKKGRDRRPL